MNVFILEDDPNNYRIPMFQEKLQNHTLYIAKDVEQGKKTLEYILKQGIHLDFIFLDHDLGGRVYVDSQDPNVGTRIAEFIQAHEEFKDAEVYFHTQNIVGAYAMKVLLPKGIIYPFPELIENLSG
jgi:hypothetical protein